MRMPQPQRRPRIIVDRVLVPTPALRCERIVRISRESTREIPPLVGVRAAAFHPDLVAVVDLRRSAQGRQQPVRHLDGVDVRSAVRETIYVMVADVRHQLLRMRIQFVVAQHVGDR